LRRGSPLLLEQAVRARFFSWHHLPVVQKHKAAERTPLCSEQGGHQIQEEWPAPSESARQAYLWSTVQGSITQVAYPRRNVPPGLARYDAPCPRISMAGNWRWRSPPKRQWPLAALGSAGSPRSSQLMIGSSSAREGLAS